MEVDTSLGKEFDEMIIDDIRKKNRDSDVCLKPPHLLQNGGFLQSRTVQHSTVRILHLVSNLVPIHGSRFRMNGQPKNPVALLTQPTHRPPAPPISPNKQNPHHSPT